AVHVDPKEIQNAHFGPTPGVAPTKEAVLGGRAPAQSHIPPASVTSRPVMAKHTPPPPPAKFEAKQQLLAKNDGRPLAPSEVRSLPKVNRPAPMTAGKPRPPQAVAALNAAKPKGAAAGPKIHPPAAKPTGPANTGRPGTPAAGRPIPPNTPAPKPNATTGNEAGRNNEMNHPNQPGSTSHPVPHPPTRENNPPAHPETTPTPHATNPPTREANPPRPSEHEANPPRESKAPAAKENKSSNKKEEKEKNKEDKPKWTGYFSKSKPARERGLFHVCRMATRSAVRVCAASREAGLTPSGTIR